MIQSIKIDSREKKRGESFLNYSKKNNPNTKINKTLLTYGDYLFNNNIVWEYKTVDDFCNSFENKTVFNEVYNQSMKYHYSYLIIVGGVNRSIASRYYKVPYYSKKYKSKEEFVDSYLKQFKGAIRRCRVVANVILCNTEEEAFNEMIKQSQKCADDKNYTGQVRPISKKQEPNNQIRYLTETSGISKETAKKIIKKYNIKNLQDLLELNYDKLIKIQGIGDKRAKKIIKELY